MVLGGNISDQNFIDIQIPDGRFRILSLNWSEIVFSERIKFN
jgi:hypothetical protein